MIGAAFGVGFVVGPALGAVLSLWDVRGILWFVPGVNPFSGPALAAFLLSVVNLAFIYYRFPETLKMKWKAGLRMRSVPPTRSRY